MSMDVQTSMRLPSALLDRADALMESLEADPSLSMMGKMTRSKVLRLALNEGLRVLESRTTPGASPRHPPASFRAHARGDLATVDERISQPVSHPYTRNPTPIVAMEED